MGKIIRFDKRVGEAIGGTGSQVRKRPVAAFTADADGQFVFVNTQWSRLSGLEQEHALGTGWVQSVHHEDRDEVIRNWRAAVRGERPFGCSYRVENKKSDAGWVLCQAVPQYDDDGELCGYNGTLVNLSGLSKEFPGEFAEARLRVILDLLGVAYYEHNLRSGQLIGSSGFESIVGSTRSAREFYALIHPDDLDRIQNSFAEFVAKGGTYKAEYRFTTVDGEWQKIRDYARIVYDSEGNAAFAVGFLATYQSAEEQSDRDHIKLVLG